MHLEWPCLGSRRACCEVAITVNLLRAGGWQVFYQLALFSLAFSHRYTVPHTGSHGGQEWENNQQRKEWEKGCHATTILPPGCPFRIWLVFRWFLCGRLIYPLFKVETGVKIDLLHSVMMSFHVCVFISSTRHHFLAIIKSFMKPQGKNRYLCTVVILFFSPPHRCYMKEGCDCTRFSAP